MALTHIRCCHQRWLSPAPVFIVTTGYCCTALMRNGFQMNDSPPRLVFTFSPLTGATVNVAFDVLMHFPAAHLALGYLGFWQNNRVAGGPGTSTETKRQPHRRRLHFTINWATVQTKTQLQSEISKKRKAVPLKKNHSKSTKRSKYFPPKSQ